MASRGSTSTAAQRLADPLVDTLPPWPWRLDDKRAPRTLGWHAIAWAEGGLGEFYPDEFPGLVQPNGPRARQRFRFTPRQRTFLLWWYAVDDDGRWLFHHGARRLAKGSGKSPFAAVFALAEFCAPVRFESFNDRAVGGCIARPVDMPLVQIAATAESQTANTMRMVRAFAPKGSAIVEHYNLDPGKTLYYRLPEGTLQVITSSVTAAEGAETSAVIADETEHWKPSNQGPDLAATLIDNLAKSGSRMIETSNAWVPGHESVAEETWDTWVAQEEGRLRAEQRTLYDAVMAPPDTDTADPKSLRAALEFVYADCPWQDVHPIMQRIWTPSARESESKRKYLNWPTASENAWVDPEAFRRLADPSIEVKHDEPIVLFFDGSKSDDATALVGCRVEDGHVFLLGGWEPHDGVEVDHADVDRVVSLTFEHYNVCAFFADVREFESWVLTEWPRRYGDDLLVHAVPTGRPTHPIAWDMRGHRYEFAKACEAVYAEIAEGAFTHDGNSMLVRHVLNARERHYRDAVSITKESPHSSRKIDAAVCMVGARMLRRIVIASGVLDRKKKAAGSLW